MSSVRRSNDKILTFYFSNRDQEFILAALAQTALNIYALESMIYLSTGILDEYDNPKVHLETALTKAFSQDILKNVVEVSTNLLRTSATIAGYQIEEDIRNAVQLQALGGTSDALKKYVATKGLQHCAVCVFGHRSIYISLAISWLC